MAKMRSLAPAFIISVGVLFVLFMVISDSSVMEALGGGRTNDVGSVNGQDISYQDFSKILDQQRENQKNQTGKDIDEDNMAQFRDQVWNAVVTQTLIEQQIKKYGITVSTRVCWSIISETHIRYGFRFSRQGSCRACVLYQLRRSSESVERITSEIRCALAPP